ncbi:histidine kinase [Clostridium carboxidivorans P7]|uniref:histidine kinase n=1 Tax=Clostridium carboxidivorans P7 TaxID=536227 RepID=C6Q119_9CLOT|nr:ATP-binding protein [Clostridium carboxidivorans]AKN32890.1 histidine kinase [Clostridium carboxidivorans P7]EET84813.1 signal transduction histidine kinase regulating citrate/malate metabolism [Clostridium carboxidivorans P7]EFG89863.1 ATPase, histidine kinase-, DNA gyrase B-, and HSP90-like domain protein [Clostridium carboxidivorans P7]
MKKLKRTLTVVIGVAIASQIYFGFLIQDFTIALSVIIFSVFLYNYTELNPIQTAILTGISTTFCRSVWVYCSNMDFMKTIRITTPEIMFFTTFGILFYFLYYKNGKKDLTRFILSVFCCDFISNVVEISIRTRISGENSNMIKALLLVAIVRTLVVLIILILMKYYNSFLVKEEHEERYRKLILLTSSFKSEIYFMNKNASEIEDVMKKSFSVYEIVSKNHYSEELKNLTLDIAKDIHEIKKDYIRVMRGLEEMSNEKIDVEHMKIKDIISILEIYTKDYIIAKSLNIELDFKVECNFYVSQHFYLVSIIRNLIFNGIEAIDSNEKGLIKLQIVDQGDEYVFIVSDNGTGINEGNLDFIFNPGFSTKYDKSGSICRGIGLTLVKDLTQNIFKGSISVESVQNEGTTFTVKIPISSFRR